MTPCLKITFFYAKNAGILYQNYQNLKRFRKSKMFSKIWNFSKIVIKNCHRKLSSKIVIKNCHQKLSSKIVIKIVIKNCDQKLSSTIVIKNCHQKCHHQMSSKIVIDNCHQLARTIGENNWCGQNVEDRSLRLWRSTEFVEVVEVNWGQLRSR